MLKIESKQNGQVKLWKKLHTAKGRKKQGQYIVEGEHLVQEVLASPNRVSYILFEAKYQDIDWVKDSKPGLEKILISPAVVQELSQTENSQGIFAIVDMQEPVMDIKWDGRPILLVDGVQDPGNLGTIIRTADAASWGAVYLGIGTVDPYNEKVLRASQGSIWHLPLIHCDLNILVGQLKDQEEYSLVATALHQEAVAYRDYQPKGPLALIVGNEGQGVSQALIDQADQAIYIPMPGQAESLNVAVATGILVFHYL